jgi:hypothetical protein
VNGEKRDGGAALDAETGELDPAWAPQLGIVSDAVALTPDHVIVVTGTHVDAYDPASGQRDPAFRLSAGPDGGVGEDSAVGTLVVSGGQLYLGGRFRRVNGADRSSVARVDARTGRFDRGWKPPELAFKGLGCRRCPGRATTVAVTPEAVVVAGDFNTVGGARIAGEGLAAFDTRAGRPTAFRAARPGRSADGYAGLYGAAAVIGDRVFAGGDFGAAPTHGFVTLDAHTGKVLPSPWHPRRRHALVKRVVPSGPNVLVAGDKLGD